MRLILLFFAITLFTLSTDAQVPRKMLVEETTQASCPPCAANNLTFDALVLANLDVVVPVKYQVWWPGPYPMYDQNPTDVQARVNELGPNVAPNIYVNGGNFESIGAINQARIDAFKGMMSPISITITFDNDGENEKVKASVVVKNETSAAFSAGTYRLYTLLMEDVIHFQIPPGATSERDYHWVMRKMYPNGNGILINEELAPGGEFTFNIDENHPSYIYNLDEMAIKAFVTNESSGEVIQAEAGSPVMASGYFVDIESSYTLSGYNNFCSRTLMRLWK